ncbi:NAD(P)-dependent alcohol dehydrogenase [soil metagenome]
MSNIATTNFKAYQLNSFDINDIKAIEKPVKRPHGTQVLVRIKAASLNYRDILVYKGYYSKALPLPIVPLSDGAGEVVEIGGSVTRVKVGDRVSPNFMTDWISGEVDNNIAKTALGGFVDGMLQEYRLIDQDALTHIPDHLSYEEGATLPCAAVTAWHGLVVNGKVKAGDTVLVMGTGGVSIFAMQFARLAGAKVIATSSSEQKLARLKEMGASHTINYKQNEKWDEAVLEYTGGRGVDHVIEVGGSGTLDRSLNAVRMGGHVSLIGVLASGQVNPVPILMKSIKVHGVFVGSRSMFDDMNRAITAHKLKPVIDKVFSSDEIVPALQYMESGQHFGKIVLSI